MNSWKLCRSGGLLSPLRPLIWLRRGYKEPIRKPVWMPKAASKLFVFPEPSKTPKDEVAQLERLEEIYRSEIKSISEFFRAEFFLPVGSSGGMTQKQVKDEELEQARLLEENDRENQRMAQLRVQRNEEEAKSKQVESLILNLKKSEEMKQLKDEVENLVRAEIRREPTYITKNTLDAAIEEALLNPVKYDFALDLEGNVHFSGKLHPYAFKPTALPETSSNINEVNDKLENNEVKLKK